MLTFVLLWRETGYFGALMTGAAGGAVVARVRSDPYPGALAGRPLGRVHSAITVAGGPMVLLALVTRSSP